MKHCSACLAKLAEAPLDSYAFCENCGSFQYLSNKSAELENAEYFESSDVWLVNTSTLKRVLFKPFRLLDMLMRWTLTSWLRFHHRIKPYQNKQMKILEIGFGNGEWLAGKLQAGFNALGIDLSGEAVRRFQTKYPRYKDKVKQSTKPDQVFDLIYANAIFEHLDEADDFISHLNQSLSRDGAIQLGIPTTKSGMDLPPGETEFDINFWKPCHRLIYSFKGLEALLSRYSLQISASHSVDPYVYRIMNQMLKLGYADIHHYRTPFYSTDNAPGILLFIKILTTALFTRSCSMWTEVLITRKSLSNRHIATPTNIPFK